MRLTVAGKRDEAMVRHFGARSKSGMRKRVRRGALRLLRSTGKGFLALLALGGLYAIGTGLIWLGTHHRLVFDVVLVILLSIGLGFLIEEKC